MKKFRWFDKLAFCVAGITVFLALSAAADDDKWHIIVPDVPESSGNRSNDRLLLMNKYSQAEMLSKATGYSCAGKDPFYMGTVKTPPNKGVSLWSITCGRTSKKFMIAIAPDATGNTKVVPCKSAPWSCYDKLGDKD